MAGSLLAGLVTALTTAAEDSDALLQASAGGWPTMLDLATTTQPAWLAQLAGVQVDTTTSLDAQRAAILAHPMWKRGTPAAVTALAQTFLTGTKRVDLFERDGGSAWALRVRVFTPQLANPATTAADVKKLLLQTKPVGITLAVEVFPGSTWNDINTKFASWSAVMAAAPTWNDVLTGTL